MLTYRNGNQFETGLNTILECTLSDALRKKLAKQRNDKERTIHQKYIYVIGRLGGPYREKL